MSTNDLWGEDESFSDMPEEAQTVSGKPAPPSGYVPPVTRQLSAPKQAVKTAPQVPVQEESEEELEEVQEEEDFSEVLTDANLRLEQGMLYKAILNHNLFEGMEADPKAVHNVQREIRNFAKERMEVMLGMRRESATVERLEIDFPFNALEVDVLKSLAHTATKGATEESDRYVPSVARVTEEIPMVGAKRKTLNPIGSPAKKTMPSKPLQKKAAAPVKRTKLDETIEQIAREEGVPVELLEVNTPGLGKNAPDSLEERNRIASKRLHTQVKSATAMPPATYEQQEMKAAAQVGTFSSTPLGQRILDAVKNMPITKT